MFIHIYEISFNNTYHIVSFIIFMRYGKSEIIVETNSKINHTMDFTFSRGNNLFLSIKR